jgi:hypothetical protein
MFRNPKLLLSTLLALASLLHWDPFTPSSLAAPPQGLSIGARAECVSRKGGHNGYHVFPEFVWYYAVTADLGPEVTIGGNYSIQLHNPTTDEYETIRSHPYGFSLEPGIAEKRTNLISTTRPHWVFDHVRLEITWQIDTHGLSGSEVAIVGCSMSAPPPGLEPIVGPTPTSPAEPELDESFVHIVDASPYPWLVVDSWLQCGRRETGGGQLVTWGVWANNNDTASNQQGVTVSGSALFYTRTREGEYTLAQETPFALVLESGESNGADGYLEIRPRTGAPSAVAAKLEVEWRASLGRSVDPAAPVQHILRTTACQK